MEGALSKVVDPAVRELLQAAFQNIDGLRREVAKVAPVPTSPPLAIPANAAVLVTGFFDTMHAGVLRCCKRTPASRPFQRVLQVRMAVAGHVRFLRDAAVLGALHVVVRVAACGAIIGRHRCNA